VRTVPFVKAHARGNDFLVIEETQGQGQHAAMAKKLCARTTGIGADGIEFYEKKPDGTYFLRLFNADGSEGELSGNGTRCVAAWLAQNEGVEQATFGTHGGVRRSRLIRREGSEWWMESAMGVPRVMSRAIEVPGVEGVIEGAMVNVGNPHYVIFVESEDFSSHGLAWQVLGEKIGMSPLFKFGTNVEFVRVLGPNEIAFRIWERGVGPTMSSGTGTSASSSAAIMLRGAERSLMAHAEGGAQTVVWPANEEELLLTGPAEIICRGEVEFG
jgi:diaminopimelate epimerase